MLLDPNRSSITVTRRGRQLAVAGVLFAFSAGLSQISLRPLTADEPPIAPAEPTAAPALPVNQAVSQIKVFTIKSGDAAARADMLRSVLGQGSSVTQPLRISADPRTNSIVVSGCAEDLEVILGILNRLDETPPPPLAPPAGVTIPPPPTIVPSSGPGGLLLPANAVPSTLGGTAITPANNALVPIVPAQAARQIVMNCVVLELSTDGLVKALPEVNEAPHSSPTLSVVVQENTKWSAVIDKLESADGATLYSRPQIKTRDQQAAVVHVAVEDAKKGGPNSLTLAVTPQIVLSATEPAVLSLMIDAREKKSEPTINPPEAPLHRFHTTVKLPLGKCVFIADRSLPGRALVVALEPSVIEVPTALPAVIPPGAIVPPRRTVKGGSLTYQTSPAGAQATVSGPVDPALRQELLRLRGEIDALLKGHPVPRPADAAPMMPPSVRTQSNQPATPAPAAQPVPPQAPPAPSTPTPFAMPGLAPRNTSRATQRKLLELDLKDAELEVQAAKAELDGLMQIRRTNPSAISQSQFDKAQVLVRRAEIRVQKLQVMLDADNPPPLDPVSVPTNRPR